MTINFKVFLIVLLIFIFTSVRCSHAADTRLMDKIIKCESSGRTKVWGDHYQAYGIAQFHKETFYRFARKAHMEYPNWFSPTQQIYLLGWALDHGHSKSWTCYTKIMKEKKIEHRKRIEHFRAMYLRGNLNTQRKPVWNWYVHYLDRNVYCRNNGFV